MFSNENTMSEKTVNNRIIKERTKWGIGQWKVRNQSKAWPIMQNFLLRFQLHSAAQVAEECPM